MQPILEVKNLVKRYKTIAAVDGISFKIQPGICFGLLGPNGAGKSSALEVIEDILPPTSGEILFNGAPIQEASFREKIGIQFQHTSLLDFLTVRDTIRTFMSLYRDPEQLDLLADLCNLHEFMDRMNNKLSGGQTQRLMLALALINKPQLVFLDEPSTGLDPQARRNLWEIVRGIKEKGRTIILTTHSMDEAEYLCDQIAIMDHGRIIAEGSPAELVERYCTGGTITLPRENVTIPLSEIPFPWRETNGRLEISTDRINTGLERLLAMQINLAEMTVHSPNLEDVFLNLTGRKLRD
ncbi:MAG: ABC transporter ATP-binding protein [Proteobacteria bacterium]|nr:ABC transporter ATP-binding protein [Pseudomonadota bacterium]MBU1736693.1 ABC transporter ATP-binding protein [Pseudomonadota bacterium]